MSPDTSGLVPDERDADRSAHESRVQERGGSVAAHSGWRVHKADTTQLGWEIIPATYPTVQSSMSQRQRRSRTGGVGLQARVSGAQPLGTWQYEGVALGCVRSIVGAGGRPRGSDEDPESPTAGHVRRAGSINPKEQRSSRFRSCGPSLREQWLRSFRTSNLKLNESARRLPVLQLVA